MGEEAAVSTNSRLQLSQYIHSADCYHFYENPFCAQSAVISVYQHKKCLASGVFQISVPTFESKYLPNVYTGIHDALHVLTELT